MAAILSASLKKKKSENIQVQGPDTRRLLLSDVDG